MAFAIVKIGTQQLFVKVDDTIFIEKVEGKIGDKIVFDQVLATKDLIGKPTIDKLKVVGVIEKQSKQKKIVVYRHNQKSTHKRKYGHRQPYTRVKIAEIVGLNNV